jgi:hypothetical protein
MVFGSRDGNALPYVPSLNGLQLRRPGVAGAYHRLILALKTALYLLAAAHFMLAYFFFDASIACD